MLHVPAGLLFTLVLVGTVYSFKTGILKGNYPVRAVIGDLYSTWIFYCSHFALFHAYNFWLDTQRRYRKEQEYLIKEQQLKDLAHQGELKALKSQIEPHFLFNTLNSISASVPPDQENTRVLIARLADTFRYALMTTERDTVSLSEEIEFIKTWLALEKHRLGNRLATCFEIDDEVLCTPVPPMILQPLVENALNHGIAPKINGGTVTIQCKRVNNFVSITVSDTGIGYKGNLEQMFEAGIGLSNISRRLKLLHGQPLHAEKDTQGLRFCFKLPIVTGHEEKSIHN